MRVARSTADPARRHPPGGVSRSLGGGGTRDPAGCGARPHRRSVRGALHAHHRRTRARADPGIPAGRRRRSDEQAPGDRDAPGRSVRPAADLPAVRRAAWPRGTRRFRRSRRTSWSRRSAGRRSVRGCDSSPGLVAEMIADVAHQPGGLPLLQYALTELFERRDGGSTDACGLPRDRRCDRGAVGAGRPSLLERRRGWAAGDRAGLPPPRHARRGATGHAKAGRDRRARHPRRLRTSRSAAALERTAGTAPDVRPRALHPRADGGDRARGPAPGVGSARRRGSMPLERTSGRTSVWLGPAAEWRGSGGDPSFLMGGCQARPGRGMGGGDGPFDRAAPSART